MLQLLSIARYQINDCTLAHLMFLDFLLKKFEPTPLVEALTIALPLLFQAQLTLQLDHENVKELVDCLGFVARNKVAEKSTTTIVTALTMHGDQLSPTEAAAAISALCDLPYSRMYERLVKNCLAVLSRDLSELPFNRVDSILTKVVEKYTNGHAFAFYDENFYDKCAEYAVRCDNEPQKLLFVLKKFNKIVSLPIYGRFCQRKKLGKACLYCNLNLFWGFKRGW